jgi:hypothetical protein
MSALCSARGTCPFLCPWSRGPLSTELHCSTVVQYEKRADTEESPTNEIPFNIWDVVAIQGKGTRHRRHHRKPPGSAWKPGSGFM